MANRTPPATQGQQAFGTGQQVSVQSVVTNLQNLVTAVNALTSQISTQFGSTGLYATASLPTPSSSARAFVSDSTVVASGNFGVAVVGGGTHTVPVYYDNVSWKIG